MPYDEVNCGQKYFFDLPGRETPVGGVGILCDVLARRIRDGRPYSYVRVRDPEGKIWHRSEGTEWTEWDANAQGWSGVVS